MEIEMTEIEKAKVRLDAVRKQRIWAAQRRDFALEQALASESYECWCKYEQLRSALH